MTIQQPSVGRVVHYHCRQGEPAYDTSDPTKPHPALITGIVSDTAVNLTVFFDRGPVEVRPAVEFGEPHAGDASWSWPPFVPANVAAPVEPPAAESEPDPVESEPPPADPA